MRKNSVRYSTARMSISNNKIRNIRDPNFKQQCISKLQELIGSDLEVKNYDLPTLKEVQSIFKYLYIQIEPFTEYLDLRFEEEVINFLRMIKYPYMNEINKSQLLSITPHSWPPILCMLSWLVQLILLTQKCELGENNLDKLFFNFCCEGYTNYILTGNQDLESESLFIEQVKKMIENKKEEITILESNRNLMQEKINNFYNSPINNPLKNLENKKEEKICDLPNLITKLQNQKEELLKDIKFKKAYKEDLFIKIKEFTDRKSFLEAQRDYFISQLNIIKKEKENLDEKILEKKIDSQEIDLMNSQLQNQKLELENLRRKKEALKKEVSEIENIFIEKFEEIEKIEEFNEQTIFKIDFEEILRNSKDQFDNLIKQLNSLNNEKIALLESKSDTETLLSLHNDKLKDLNNRLINISRQYLAEKQDCSIKQRSCEKDLDLIKDEIRSLKLKGNNSFNNSEHEKEKSKLAFDVLVVKLDNEREEIVNAIKGFMVNTEKRFKEVDKVLKDII